MARTELERRAVVRRAVLAVSVLEDLDVAPCEGGVQVRVGDCDGLVSWADLDATFARGGLADIEELLASESHPAQAQYARARLSTHLRLGAMVWDSAGREQLRDTLRLVALPADHVFHLGPPWVRGVVLGGVLQLGLGVVDVLPGRDDAVPLPAPIATQLGVGTPGVVAASRWDAVVAHAEEMGELAATRLRRDTHLPDRAGAYRIWPGSGALPSGVLRPVGGVDALSLLATRAVRRELASNDPSGMRAVAVPMRSRGWYDLTRTDPSFVAAAWAATDAAQRGAPTPLLVTNNEVAAVGPRLDLRAAGDDAGATAVDVRGSRAGWGPRGSAGGSGR